MSQETPRASLMCAYCGEEILPWERSVDRLRGICGKGEKSGQPMVIPDPYDPEPPNSFHEECEEVYFLDLLSKRQEDEEESEKLKFCAGCGVKIGGD